MGALLCAQDRFATDAHGLPWRFLVGVVLACGGLQGAAMGAFDGPSLQIVVSALKVPILIGVATLLALPSLFVVNTVIGLREDFADVLRAIFTAQATVAIALAALAPVLLFAYASASAIRSPRRSTGCSSWSRASPASSCSASTTASSCPPTAGIARAAASGGSSTP